MNSLPYKVIAIITAVALVPIVGCGVWLWVQWGELAPPVQMTLRLLIIGSLAGLFAVVCYQIARALSVAITIAWNRWGAVRSVEADKVIGLARANRPLPDGVQSVSWHDSRKMLPQPVEEPVSVPQLPPGIPTMGDLLDRGEIGQKLILGYAAETGQPLTGSWKDLYSSGVGGWQGSGKSWLCCFLLAQSAAMGGKLIVCDPNPNTPESISTRIAALAPAFMCDVATEDDEILNALRLANDKLERRKAGQAGQWPIVVMVDEWSSLLRGRLGAELPALVQNISEQGRKYNVNALLSAQGWTVAAAGIVRNRLTSHYVLRQRDQEARYQLGMRADQVPNDIPGLPDATGYFLPARGALTRVIIPHMTIDDIARAATLIDRPAKAPSFGFTVPTAPLQPVVASCKPDGSQMVAKPIMATTATERIKTASPEATRAAGLFVAGKSPAEIVEALRGVKSSEGRKYQQALNEILDLVREGIR